MADKAQGGQGGDRGPPAERQAVADRKEAGLRLLAEKTSPERFRKVPAATA